MKIIIFLLFVPLLLWGQNSHKNILISDSYAPNEPTIALDPKNPNVLLAGSNINNIYISKDGGHHWVERKLRSTYGVWGDPVIVCDTASNFYFFHLSNPPNGNWIDRIVCQKTSDNAQSWSNGSYMGLNGKKAQDKQWVVVDRKKNYLYATWTQFDKYASKEKKDKSSILFSMSKDEGKTWSTAQKINEVDGDCMDKDETTEGAVPTIGPNGEVYVAWAGPKGLVFDRSLDEGKTWLKKDIAIDPMPGGWDIEIEGIRRSNGLPITACDLSSSPHNGTIYVNWADQRNGTNDTDIWLSKSTDKGDSWSKPVRVNNDKKGRHQFLTWMTIDPTNGYLYFVFYDRRNTKGSATEVYMARSIDGGSSFVNFKVSDSPFTPNPKVFFGDYNNIVAQGAIVRPIWTRLDDAKLGIYTAIVDLEIIKEIEDNLFSSLDNKGVDSLVDGVRVLAKNRLYISFKLHKKRKLTLHIFDENGKKIKPFFRQKIFDYGKHIEEINLLEIPIPTGKYTYQLKCRKKLIKTDSFEKQ